VTRRRAALALLAASPTAAHAHLTSSGLGPVYDGILHFVTSPEDFAAVVALALFAGLRGPQQGRWTLLALPCAWLLGGLAGLVAMTPQSNGWLSAGWLLAVGLLVALDAKLPLAATTVIATSLGLLSGYANGSGMNLSVPVALALLGLATSVFVATALPAAAVVRFGDAWRRIAVRVVGSWIAASGLLLLGWAIRGV
jgi:urease accessory protein